MNRIVQFDSPFLLGFEHTRSLIERAARAAQDGYPPYNVEAVGEDRLRITLAVAGFAAGDLQVSVENRQLTVSGKGETVADRDFLHQGIAARAFSRTFVLADGMEVSEAILGDGLLQIDVHRPRIEPAVRQVPIRTGTDKRRGTEPPEGTGVDLSRRWSNDTATNP